MLYNTLFYRHTEGFSPKYQFVPTERTTPQVLLDSSLTLRMTFRYFSNTFLYLRLFCFYKELLIIPPPSTVSSRYNTTDCPGAMAFCRL